MPDPPDEPDPTDASNPLLAILVTARTHLRDCYWFRRLADADDPWDETAAEARIYFDELPPPANKPDHDRHSLSALRPFALVWVEVQNGLTLQSTVAGQCCWQPSGIIVIQLELPVPEELATQPHALAEHLHRQIGRIIRTRDSDQPGLCDLAGLPGYLPINIIRYRGYLRTDSKLAADIGDAVVCELELHWGVKLMEIIPRITYPRGSARGMRRMFNEAQKAALHRIGIMFHAEMRPKRFTVEHARAAGFGLRKGEGMDPQSKRFRRSYTGRKLRIHGHTNPLQFSGKSKDAARSARVTSTSNVVRISYAGTQAFNYRHPRSRIRMHEEFRRLTDSERTQLAMAFDRHLREELAKQESRG